jgi:para-nitrobenzyl esterase
MPGFQSLAYHTGDIQYLFPGFHGGPEGIEHPLNQLQEFLSDELVTAWTNFARTGNPNGQGNQPWPLFEDKPNEPGVLSESIPNLYAFTDAEISERHNCVFWGY